MYLSCITDGEKSQVLRQGEVLASDKFLHAKYMYEYNQFTISLIICLFQIGRKYTRNLSSLNSRKNHTGRSSGSIPLPRWNTHWKGWVARAGCWRKEGSRASQRWCRLQVKPPFTIRPGRYRKVSASIMSTMGTTTVWGLFDTRSSSGSSQLTLASMWLSKNISTWNNHQSN